ncbi:hypothetical protein TK06_09920 [Pseudomonas fluorescens]|uniref:Uncharacterized protein n=1 Tax=Pseudomonas fluorescens TaxID=294 RepID=A0A165Z533_PSEFL|nr:hypothetical protein TK06_09920 [Pseudomonas fluorescens]
MALKKYRGGIESHASTCDKEHTTASLGQAEILGIQDAPRDCSLGAKHNTCVRPSLPWGDEFMFFASQCCDKTSEGVAPIGEHAENVFPDDDGFRFLSSHSDLVDCIGKLHKCKSQSTSSICQARAKTRHTECLARRAANQNGRSLNDSIECLAGQSLHVAEIRYGRVMMGQHRTRERCYFGKPSRGET